MRFAEVFGFEVGYQLRRVWTWLFALTVLVFTFLLATQAYVNEARHEGFLFNGPFVIAHVMFLGSLPGLLMAALLAGDAAARDVHTRIHPLLYTTPVGKPAYLAGRFLAAFVLTALILLAAPVAHVLATWSLSLEPELLGPFRPAAYLRAYLLMVVPNAFLATSLAFGAALFSRRATVSYLGSVLVFFLSFFCWLFLASRLGRWDLANLLDPLGTTGMAELGRRWTTAELSTRMLRLEGSQLTNRLIWLACALLVWALTLLRFRFAHITVGGAGRRRSQQTDTASIEPDIPIVPIPHVHTANTMARNVRQALAIASDGLRAVLFGWGGIVLLLLTLLNVLAGPSWFTHLGTPQVPVTARVLEFLAVPLANSGEVLWMIVPLLIIFYAGELFWRERDTGLSDIADAAPVPDGALLVGKFLGLGMVVLAFQLLSMLAGVLIQMRLRYYHFELALYVRTLLGFQLVDFLLFALLALFVHVLIDQKYIAHMALLLVYAYLAFAQAMGIEHNLLVYGGAPEWSYSDLRGFAGSVTPWLWFKLYWAAWALLLGVLAKLLWVRGREHGFGQRVRLSRMRFQRGPLVATALALAMIGTLGGFIFYNTNVLNAHHNASERLARRAEYEQRYGRYRNAPRPVLMATSLEVAIHPEQSVVRVRGTHTFRNTSEIALDTLHVATSSEVRVTRLSFARAARRVTRDKRLRHHIYVLREPLQPGDILRLDFELAYEPRGFTNDGVASAVTGRSTYFTNNWLPALGYQPDRELSNAGERREYGLPAKPSVSALDDVAARYDLSGEAPIAFAAVVSTSANQTAVAPGELQRTWSRDGRRYFRYATTAPIRNDYAVFSAEYVSQEARWRDVAIQVLHHPAHTIVVPHMLRSVAATLHYQTRQLGPYPYRRIRLVERPGGAPELHAFPINMSFQEGFALFNPAADRRDLDFAFAVVAHEVAHQWWGNQLMPAPVEGRALLSESLAWYSAFGVVEATYGHAHLERLLELMRASLADPRARAGVPLLRAYDSFLGYRKGPLALYALREYIGTEHVNAALRRFFQQHSRGEPPLPTTRELYAELRAVTPDSLRPLLADLFERNTYWELATKQVTSTRLRDGKWLVSMDVSARKVVVDTAGTETEMPITAPIEIGVFAADTQGAPLYLQKHRMRAGKQRISVIVARPPVSAGIDPRRLLMDVEPDDNVMHIARSRSVE